MSAGRMFSSGWRYIILVYYPPGRGRIGKPLHAVLEDEVLAPADQPDLRGAGERPGRGNPRHDPACRNGAEKPDVFPMLLLRVG